MSSDFVTEPRPDERHSTEPKPGPSLFADSPRPESRQLAGYRSISKTAIVSLVAAVISVPLVGLSITSEAFWGAILLPVLGTALGAIALAHVLRSPDALTGKLPAMVGTFVSLATFVFGVVGFSVFLATEVPDGYQPIVFDDLEPAEKRNSEQPIPDEIRKLEGKQIFVRGYVHPSGAQGAGPVKDFILVGDMQSCCFGGQPKLTDMIEVTLVGGDTVEYSWSKRRLGGVLQIDDGWGMGGSCIHWLTDGAIRRKPESGVERGYYKLEADYVQ